MAIEKDDVWGEAEREAYAGVRQDLVDTLEFLHDNFVNDEGHADSVRIVIDEEDLTATLEDSAPMNPGHSVLFNRMAARVVLPGQEDGRLQAELTITVDNVPRDILPNIRRAATTRSEIEVIHRVFTKPDGVLQSYLYGLRAKVIEVTNTSISLRAHWLDLLSGTFPREHYDPTSYPALYSSQ